MERTAALRGRTRTHKFAVMPGKRAASRGPAAAPPIRRETSTAPKVRQQASSAGKHSRADPAKAQTEPKARLSGQVACLWGYAQERVPGPASTISVSRRKTFGFDPDPTVEYMLRLEIRYKCEPCCRPPSTPVRQHRTAKDAPVIAHRLAALLQRELSKGSLSHASPYDPFILSTPKSAGTSNLPLATVLDQELCQPVVSLSVETSESSSSRDARSSKPEIVQGAAAASLARHLGQTSSDRERPAEVREPNVALNSRDDVLKMTGQGTVSVVEQSAMIARARTNGFISWVPWLHPSGTGGTRPKDLREWIEEEASRLRAKFGVPKNAISPLMERFNQELERVVPRF